MIERREAVPEAGDVLPRARRSSTRRGMIRQRLTPRPITASIAGSSVADAAIETSGTSSPPTPIERMNGSGMNTSSASPIATDHAGEQRRAAAVAIVVCSATCTSSVFAELLAEAEHDQHRVVDRDRQPDQRDDVRDVDRHVHRCGRRPTRARASSGSSPRRTATGTAIPPSVPNMNTMTSIAIGSAIDSPRARSSVKIVLGVVVDRRIAATGTSSTPGRSPIARRMSGVILRRVLVLERRRDLGVDHARAPASQQRPGLAARRRRAAARRGRRATARPLGRRVDAGRDERERAVRAVAHAVLEELEPAL